MAGKFLYHQQNYVPTTANCRIYVSAKIIPIMTLRGAIAVIKTERTPQIN
jgi:hypothetical protein